jgi:hypothetical protein
MAEKFKTIFRLEVKQKSFAAAFFEADDSGRVKPSKFNIISFDS